MSSEAEITKINLKRRETELNQRLINSRNWASGEIEIFKKELFEIRNRLRTIDNKN